MITKFITILSILIAGSSVFGAVQSSLQKIVTTYERKILFDEKQWQLHDRKFWNTTSIDTWKSDNETIEVYISECESDKKALEYHRGMKGSASRGMDRDVKGLGDRAFEHISQGEVTAIIFVKDNFIIYINSNNSNRDRAETLYRFAIHILDSIENESGISRISFRIAAFNYERKILEKEKGWRLSEKSLNEKYSSNKWESEQAMISIEIFKFESPSKALEFLEGTKTSRSSGQSKNIEGLGDAAYEHYGQGLLHSIVFVKGDTLVSLTSVASDREKNSAPMRRFSKHVLDAIEGK
jgi:hypothetical protein